jgi:IS605 OrfB family transposase
VGGAGRGAVVVENLDFGDARATGRETLGRGPRGKRLRRTIAGIPTRRFRARLAGMAARRGVAVIGVDPAYTSRWGNQHWTTPLQQQTSDPATVTRHHGAAAAIGRRGPDWRSGDGRQDPAPTADRCGPTTGQARPSPRLRWQARQFRRTDTPTMRYLGSAENTRRQRPTPFGPHRTHS